MNRREWLQTAIAALPLGAQTGKRHRAALIGETGAGDYGHEWVTAGTDSNPSRSLLSPTPMKRAGAPPG